MNERIDMAMATAGKVTTYAGGAGSVIGGLSASDVGVIGGLIVAILGWLTQVYFNARRDRRERADRADRRAEHEARMAELRGQRGAATRPALAAVAALSVAAALAAFIAPWEGRELVPYRDIVGVWTVCEGVTAEAVDPGRTYTDAECDALTTDAVARHLRGVAVCIHKPLTEGQWVAVGSWTYNVGIGAACGSTLVRQINAGLPAETWCRQLLRWDYAGGKKVRGLTRRRQAEYRICIGE